MASPWIGSEDAAPFPEANEFPQAMQLCTKCALSAWRDAVVDAAFVRCRPRRWHIRDQASLLEGADVPVQVAGFDFDFTAGVVENVLADAVAVAIAGGEHGEHQ